MSSAKPTREQADLADVLELILDKGIVINADIAITVGETEMIGIELRAAIASFETAAEYGLAFPSGTDMRRVEQASGRTPLDEGGEGDEGNEIDLGIKASAGGESSGRSSDPPARRPHPTIPLNVEGDVAEEAETESGNEDAEEAETESGNEDTEEAEDASDESEETESEATDDTADAEGGEPGNP